MLLLQFIDLCILLGCDYCDSIRGIGPKRAVDLMKQHKSIDKILKHLDKSASLILSFVRRLFWNILKFHVMLLLFKQKYPVSEEWPYEQARQLFKTPEVTPAADVEVTTVIKGLFTLKVFY